MPADAEHNCCEAVVRDSFTGNFFILVVCVCRHGFPRLPTPPQDKCFTLKEPPVNHSDDGEIGGLPILSAGKKRAMTSSRSNTTRTWRRRGKRSRGTFGVRA